VAHHITGENEMKLSVLRMANVKRCEEVFHPLHSWTPTDWACAMAGEAGEACNAVKKLRRLADGTNTAKDPQTEAEALKAIGSELADTIIYIDLLAARLGLDLSYEVECKFNEVSQRMNSSVRL
jgi:NTP pyrophosphatase (non-canonical NTP hydrolase)